MSGRVHLRDRKEREREREREREKSNETKNDRLLVTYYECPSKTSSNKSNLQISLQNK